ncbi:MAG TPA: RDD family protein [Mycobacteriales bacterium]|nr:RDD family protein [Mycobacteriales bacterium]
MQPDDQVIIGEAVAVDLRLAGVGSRGIAALIDLAIVTAAQLGLLFAILLLGPGGSIATFLTLLVVIEVGVVLGYPVAMETLWRGRTLGKAVMGLRVVRDDGGPIRFRHAFFRGLVGVVLDKPGISYALLALIPMLASSRKKRLGDFAAGTLVLQDRVPGGFDAPVAMPPPLAGWAATLDLSGVDDALALRMRQYLSRALQFTPDARATLEQQIATEVTNRVGPPPPGTPNWAVLAAVLAERRRRAMTASPPPWHPQQATPAQPAWPYQGPDPAAAATTAPPTPDGYLPPG